jgi:Cu/Ag efflux pump CusA
VRVEDDSRALGSVARVVEDHPPLIGDAVLRGGTPGLLLVVEKLPGADTLEVTRGVEAALHRLGAGLAGITTDTTIFRPATYVNASTDHLRLALIIGAILVLGVLLAFLYDWRGVLVAVVSIGLSLLAAALLMDALGYTMNAMVVGGLVIALAVVADEAIVSVDGLLRRLRERGDGRGASAATAILEGVARARPIAVYATLIILLPLLPALFLTGVSGSLFTPLAVAYALGVAVAAALTVTLTPALAAALFPRGTRSRTSPLVPWVTRAYAAALGRVIARPGPALGVAVAAVAAGAAVIPFLGRAQLPAFSDTNVIVRFDAAAGTSQPEMARITARLGTELRAIPGVERVAGQIGRAVLGDRIVDVNSSQLFVRIGPDADYDATLSKVRTVVDGYPGLARDVQTYETQSLHRVGTQSKDPLVVKVFGPNYTLLRAQAERVGQALAGIDGVGAVHVERSVQQPHIDITVRLNDAQRYGLKPGDVRREAATLLAGLSVGSLFEQQKVFDVAVWTNPGTRRSLSDVTRLLLDTPSGGHVQLGKVADVRITPSPVIIRRESVSRRVEVGLAVSGRSAGDVAGDVRSRLARMTWPPEYHAELTGEAVEGHGSRNRMIGAGVVAAILAFLLMQAAFRSWRLAAALFLALPLALVGGVLAAFVADDTVTLGSLLAFLAVLALAVRNGMALVDHYRHLEEEEGVPFGPDLVLRGARERVVPIITTALAVALAMLPLVITGAIAGQEVANPIAVIVLGGVFTSTALSLFVIPALYLRFGSRAVDLATPDLDLQPR